MALPEIEVISFTFGTPPPPGKAALTVDTTPVKGEIYLDAVYQGIAPVMLQLDPGTYTISFGEVSGYIKPEDVIATLVEGQIAEVIGEYEPIAPPLAIPWWAIAGVGAGALVLYAVTRGK